MTQEDSISRISPSQVLNPALELNNASYIDINPGFDPETSPSHLLKDTYAIVYGSLANLITCPQGGRSRIFQEDYYCGALAILQEPLGQTSASLLSISITTAIRKWEPRIDDVGVNVTPDYHLPGYRVYVSGVLKGVSDSTFSASYSLPI